MATIVVGLFIPIGMFGFLAAVGLAVGVAALLAFTPSRKRAASPLPAPDLPNGEMVQRFNSYLFRTRRGLPQQRRPKSTRISSVLPALRQTLERVGHSIQPRRTHGA